MHTFVKSFIVVLIFGMLIPFPASVAKAGVPVIAEVTPVPDPTNDTTPDYAFSSSEKGVIFFSGDCDSISSVAVSGKNAVTLKALSEGRHSGCHVGVLSDSTGEWSNDLTISPFTIDTTAPVLSQVAAVPTPTSDTTPDYTFLSTEAGTVSYAGDCLSSTTSAVSGSNTVMFDALSQGVHSNCKIVVTDAAGNPSAQLSIPSFTVDTAAPTVTITAPLSGVLVTGSDVITFSDTESTVPQCSIDGTHWSACTSGVTILSDITGFAALPAEAFTLFLRDTDAAGNTGSDNEAGIVKTTPAVTDSTPPTRSGGSPSGELSSDTVQATISLTTDESATCRYSAVSGTAYGSMTGSFDTTGFTSHSKTVTGLLSGTDYRFYVRCIDSGLNANTDDYEISLSVASTSVSENSDGGSHKKKTVKKRHISQSAGSVIHGALLIQRGKHFTKNGQVALYFSRPDGGYYSPVTVRADRKGAFSVSYLVRKRAGTYQWYAVDVRTGKKSKTLTYKVK